MTKEDLKIANDNLYCANKMLEIEIKRLNENNQAYQQELCKLWDERDNTYRIINELEIWLKERLEKLDINGYDDDVFNGIELALQKLKELKGSNRID